jgi:hypothetical protein
MPMGMGGEFLINGKPMAMDEINEVVPIGSMMGQFTVV